MKKFEKKSTTSFIFDEMNVSISFQNNSLGNETFFFINTQSSCLLMMQVNLANTAA